MRISDVSKVTGIPLATLKDLRHRCILELAGPAFNEDPDEIRRWGSFSSPSVILIMGANEVRTRYGLSWQDAMIFSKTALERVSVMTQHRELKFFDLPGTDREIWAGRFDFQSAETVASDYFSGELAELPRELEKVLQRKAPDRRHGEVVGCIILNASQLVRDFFQRAREHNALRAWEER